MALIRDMLDSLEEFRSCITPKVKKSIEIAKNTAVILVEEMETVDEEKIIVPHNDPFTSNTMKNACHRKRESLQVIIFPFPKKLSRSDSNDVKEDDDLISNINQMVTVDWTDDFDIFSENANANDTVNGTVNNNNYSIDDVFMDFDFSAAMNDPFSFVDEDIHENEELKAETMVTTAGLDQILCSIDSTRSLAIPSEKKESFDVVTEDVSENVDQTNPFSDLEGNDPFQIGMKEEETLSDNNPFGQNFTPY